MGTEFPFCKMKKLQRLLHSHGPVVNTIVHFKMVDSDFYSFPDFPQISTNYTFKKFLQISKDDLGSGGGRVGNGGIGLVCVPTPDACVQEGWGLREAGSWPRPALGRWGGGLPFPTHPHSPPLTPTHPSWNRRYGHRPNKDRGA